MPLRSAKRRHAPCTWGARWRRRPHVASAIERGARVLALHQAGPGRLPHGDRESHEPGTLLAASSRAPPSRGGFLSQLSQRCC